MIVGFSHLTFSCGNLKKGISRLRELGYSLNFQENEIQNAFEKSPLLQNFEPKHDLAFLQRTNSLNIELINHNSTVEQFNHEVFPIYRSGYPDRKWLRVDLNSNLLSQQHIEKIEQAFGEQVGLFFDVDLELFLVWVSDKKDDPRGFKGAVIQSESIPNAEKLAKNLRFRKEESKDLWLFPSPFPTMSIHMIFLENNDFKAQSKKKLDAKGCTCLSFFGTVSEDSLDFSNQSQPFRVTVNSTDLLVKFLYDNSFPYVEVIQK